MGEYGTYNGNDIKIGTCEDMYYLRPDQIHLVESRTLDDITNLRFRFPFPDEDHKEPGDFDNYDRGFPVYVEPPADVQHHGVQFADTRKAGILVMLPCPYSEAGRKSGVRYQYNGYAGPARIVQQRAWAGVWATVLSCGACGALWRLPELADALPVIEALVAEGDRRERVNKGGGRGWHEMAVRVSRGYETEVPQR